MALESLNATARGLDKIQNHFRLLPKAQAVQRNILSEDFISIVIETPSKCTANHDENEFQPLYLKEKVLRVK